MLFMRLPFSLISPVSWFFRQMKFNCIYTWGDVNDTFLADVDGARSQARQTILAIRYHRFG